MVKKNVGGERGGGVGVFSFYPPQSKNDATDLLLNIFGFSLFCWLITCVFVNKQTEGIILSNHSPWHVAVISGKV